jgi:hypothetical protein
MRCFANSRAVSWCVLIASILGAPIALIAADKSQPSPAASRMAATGAASLSGGVQRYGDLPLSFEANQGQTDHQVRFLSRGSGYTFFLAPSEAVLAFSKDSHAPILHMRLEGSNADPRVSGVDQLPGVSNYFVGQDPALWRTGVPTYRKVAYENVYPGINLVYYGNQRQLEYDFVVSPGSDPRVIRLSVDGASKLTVDAEGNLVLHTDAQHSGEGNVRLLAPKAYQDIEGRRVPITGQWRLTGNTAAIHVASYDRSKALVIDPVLVYSSFLGGSQANSINRIATDAAGNAYVAGYTASGDFPAAPTPTSNTFGSGPASRGAFVAKIDPTGSSLIYTTYLSGSSDEEATGLAVDASGNVYVAGNTHSTDFPVLGAFQSACAVSASTGACSDAFLTKIAASGTALVYSTYLGGTGTDSAASLAVDARGNAYVAGFTSSVDFPVTAGVLQAKCGGSCTQNAFVAKFNPLGETLAYATYLGGSASDGAADIAVDAAGNAYLTGQTSSPDFPLATPFQKACALDSTSSTGACVATSFVAKLKADGSALIYSTYLGGSLGSNASAIALDSLGSAYVAGSTQSADFPVSNAFQKSCGMQKGATQCPVNAFVTKLTPAGNALAYSTYLGGSIQDQATGIAVNASGIAHIIGSTASTDFPIAKSVQSKLNGTSDAFVAVLNSSGKSLLFSTFHGGSSTEGGNALALDAKGNIYVTGVTASADFPVLTPFQSSCAGSCSSAFVTKMSAIPLASAAPVIAKSFTAATMQQNGTSTITFTLSNPDAANPQTGLSFTDTLPGSMVVASTPNASTTCTGGAVAATAGGTTIGLTGGGLAISPATCTVSTDVTDAAAEALTNSVQVSSTSGGTGNTANANIAVAAPPTIGIAFNPTTIALNATSSLTFTISNPAANTVALTGVGVSDTLNTGLTVTDSSSTPCGGTLTTTAATGVIALSGATIAASGTCTFSVTVTGASAADYTNTTGNVTSNEGGSGNTASASVSVLNPPAIGKSFGPPTQIPLNGTTTLTFNVSNPNGTDALTAVAFTDNLTNGLQVASTPGLVNNCTGGTVAGATAGSTTISLSALPMAGGFSCTIVVNVTGTIAGTVNNTVQVRSGNAGNGNTAPASLTVVGPPTISKKFGLAEIPLNGTTTLSFTIQNNNTTQSLSSVGFTDSLPAGLLVSTPNGLSGTCGGGTITATAGTASVSLSGATLATTAKCTFVVNVTGITAGLQNNTTTAVTSTEGGNGGTASASVTVNPPATITATAGTPQSAAIKTAFANPLVATVLDKNSMPVSGVSVTFTAPAPGAPSVTFTSPNPVTTDSSGNATVSVTANSHAGPPYNVTANLSSGPLTTPATFVLTNSAGAPATITVSSGSGQTAGEGTSFTPLVALVEDSGPNPVPNVTVTFTPVAGGTGASGTFAVATATTTALGLATASTLTANCTLGGLGAFTVNATVPPVAAPATFAETVSVGPAKTVTPTAGSTPQTATETNPFSNLLGGVVTDCGSNPVPGVTITFTATTGVKGASGTFANGTNTTGSVAATDATGTASATTLTANNRTGTFTVSGVVAGATTNATYNLTNAPGPPATITAFTAATASAVVGQAFETPTGLGAQVVDKDHNPQQAGVPVTFLAGASGAATGTFSNGTNTITVSTDNTGVAYAPFTANT